MKIAVDIDGVLAEIIPNEKLPEDHPKKKPVEKALTSLFLLNEKGHYVYLYTARPEVDRVITVDWLNKYGFTGLYKELVMDKPIYDVLIDDRAIGFKDWGSTLKQLNNI